jgi:hypothetical protein
LLRKKLAFYPNLSKILCDLLDGLFCRVTLRRDRKGRDTLVERQAVLKTKRGSFLIRQHGPNGCVWLRKATVDQGLEGGVEEDDGGSRRLFQEQAIGKAFHGSSAKRDDHMIAAQGMSNRGRLKEAEGSFAMGIEEAGDGTAVPLLDECVYIEEIPPEPFCEEAAGGGLAGAHKTGEHNTAQVGWQGHVHVLRWYSLRFYLGFRGGEHWSISVHCDSGGKRKAAIPVGNRGRWTFERLCWILLLGELSGRFRRSRHWIPVAEGKADGLELRVHSEDKE